MTTHKIEGEIGNVDVSIEVEGPEVPADHIAVNLQARCDEIRQILVEDIPPAGTQAPVSIDWDVVKQEIDERGDQA